jgi:hypothetical protein
MAYTLRGVMNIFVMFLKDRSSLLVGGSDVPLVVFVLNELLWCPRFAKLGIPVLPSELENIIQFHSVACSPGYHTSFILPIVFSHLYFIIL